MKIKLPHFSTSTSFEKVLLIVLAVFDLIVISMWFYELPTQPPGESLDFLLYIVLGLIVIATIILVAHYEPPERRSSSCTVGSVAAKGERCAAASRSRRRRRRSFRRGCDCVGCGLTDDFSGTPSCVFWRDARCLMWLWRN